MAIWRSRLSRIQWAYSSFHILGEPNVEWQNQSTESSYQKILPNKRISSSKRSSFGMNTKYKLQNIHVFICDWTLNEFNSDLFQLLIWAIVIFAIYSIILIRKKHSFGIIHKKKKLKINCENVAFTKYAKAKQKHSIRMWILLKVRISFLLYLFLFLSWFLLT